MELHIGTEIRKVLDEKGITPDWLAQKISTSRRNMYDILTREEINTGQLREISEALKYDFFSLYQRTLTEVKNVSEPHLVYEVAKRKALRVSVELDGLQTTLDYWFDVLKKVNSQLYER